MHAHNASIFLPTYLSQAWLPAAAKARLLEWKARHDLVLYASRRSPALRIDDVRSYAAKDKAAATNPWLGIVARAIGLADDGHTAKFVRACMSGERVCAEYQDHEQHGFVVRGDMWIRIAQMCAFSPLSLSVRARARLTRGRRGLGRRGGRAVGQERRLRRGVGGVRAETRVLSAC
jgi:hypothetical protein